MQLFKKLFVLLGVENGCLAHGSGVLLSFEDSMHTAVASGSKCAANGSSAVSAAIEIIS